MPLSNRTSYDLEHLAPGIVAVSGSFTGNGASNPTVIDIKGVSAVTRTALGRYTLVLPGRGTTNVSAILCTVLSPTAGRSVTVRSYTPSTRTLVLDVYDLATPTQQDLAASEQLHLLVLTKNSSAR